ncbi:density-regulated protein [Tieghemostelium lacteum]|uniref:Density-regulated protein n=1 Tax=Tieghemostelium lacteum TaxID=361077 RepID=A0A152A1J2_TIELA|nr:density-regulated protein [Tieghemostelium lacteum]|eukprot:KYQ99940.1 density-regulated protein [Tieghemostelium lacteum]
MSTETETTTTTTTTSESTGTLKPIIVDYCKVCGFPKEYCEFGPSKALCEKTNGPYNESTPSTDTNTTTTATDNIENKLSSVKIDDSKEEGHTKTSNTTKKKKESKSNSIVIEVNQRNKRKHVTKIIGLDSYGIKLSDATKVMAKKFSCGCSVVKSPTGEEIDIQGDFQDESIDLILEKWPVVPQHEIYVIIDKKKILARK